MNKRNKIMIKWIGFICLILMEIYYMEQQKYQMCVRLDVPVEHPDHPSTKFCFTAKRWLADEENYLKISDYHLIYKKGVKMPDIHLFKQQLYNFFISEKKLTKEELPYEEFAQEISQTLHGVYLRSKFDKDTFKPTIHSFLINFRVQNGVYEADFLWKMEKKDIVILSVEKPGTYRRLYSGYYYMDYIEGKPLPQID